MDLVQLADASQPPVISALSHLSGELQTFSILTVEEHLYVGQDPETWDRLAAR